MNYSDGLLYEQAYAIRVNQESDHLFYYFDYDVRSYAINMEFQHFHTFYELFILLDENASHIIEGKYYPLKMYDMVFLKPARLHKTEYPPGPPVKRLIVNFYMPKKETPFSRSLERIFSVFDGDVPVFRFSAEHQKVIFSLLNDIFTQGKNPDPIRDLTIHTKFTEFLYTVYAERRHNIYERGIMPDTSEFRIYTITAWIHENYKQDITLEMLADKFNMSPYYLSHQFRRITGFTVVSYIQLTRIRNVQQLLLYTDKKITDIAEECGFASFSQFNRTFNKFCSMSPSLYRTHTDFAGRLATYTE